MLYKRLIALIILALMVISACGEDEKPSIQGSNPNSQRESTLVSSTPEPDDAVQPSAENTDGLLTETTQPIPPPTSAVAEPFAVVNVSNADQLTEKFEAGKAILDDFVWSPDNQHLLAITSSGIRRYDSNALETPLVEFENYRNFAVISPDGHYAISHTASGETVVWDIMTGDQVFVLASEGISALFPPQFSPNGDQIAGVYNEAIQLWDATDGSSLDTLSISTFSHYNGVFYRDDGTLLAIGHDDQNTLLWDTTADELVVELGEFPLADDSPIRHSANGHVVAIPIPTASDSPNFLAYSNIGVWNTLSGEYIRRIRSGYLPGLSPDGETYIIYDYTGIIIRQIESDRDVVTVPIPQVDISTFFDLTNLALRPDESMVAGIDLNSRLLIANIETGNVSQVADFGTSIANIDVKSDGSTLLIGSLMGNIMFWDMATGEIIREENLQNVSKVYYLPDGDSILAVGTDLSIWNADDFERNSFIMSNNVSAATQISPDGRFIAVVSLDFSATSGPSESGLPPQNLRLMNVGRNELQMPPVSLPEANAFPVLRFSPDSRFLVISNGGEHLLFDIESGAQINQITINSPNPEHFINSVVAFPSDGETITIAATYFEPDTFDSTSKLWSWRVDTDQLAMLADIGPGSITDMAYSADASVLALAGGFETGPVLLWDVGTQVSLTSLGARQLNARQVLFTPDGGSVIFMADDNLVHVWGLGD